MAAVDAIVIGAGVAGLSCAQRLAAEGAKVVVLEARERIGGRVVTLRMPGLPPVEMGAQVVHGDCAATWNVIRAARLHAAALDRTREFTVRVGAETYPITEILRAGIVPPWQVEEEIVRRELGDWAATEVIRSCGIGGLSRVMALEWLTQVWAADPGELSVDGMRRIASARAAGTGEFTIIEGYDRIAEHLAERLDIRLAAPVHSISWRRGIVQLRAGGQAWCAPAAVITVPPAVVVAGGLRFEPALPAAKAQAAEAIPAGDAVCVVLRVSVPAPVAVWGLVVGARGGFWRADAGSCVVQGWMKGPSARHARRLSPDAASLARLAGGVLPWLRPGMVEEVHVADWGADPYALGAFSSPRVGALDQPARWAEPEEATLFFAGEATCGDRHPASVHGAIESGARVAGDVVGVLDGTRA